MNTNYAVQFTLVMIVLVALAINTAWLVNKIIGLFVDASADAYRVVRLAEPPRNDWRSGWLRGFYQRLLVRAIKLEADKKVRENLSIRRHEERERKGGVDFD